MRIGVDSGGTFTDFVVLHDDGHLESFKLRSDPAAPARVVLEGIAKVGATSADVVHGSTVATNALLERKGARTALVTTTGFEDLLAIGRQNRPELYNLTPALPSPLVPAERCFGVKERMLFDGSVLIPLQDSELERLREDLENSDTEAVAICLLHSYRNDVHERAVLEALRGLGYVCASCEISPEFREYERASTTAINAYVGPLIDRYLGELERASPHPVAIMQANGGLLTAGEARVQPVRTILSGPAGGIVGAVEIARPAGFDRALTFDMGGTSTDVALASAEQRLTTEARIDNLPVRVPMLDIHTVGAGGGSIARVDSGGSLLVGPESAGATPGPACYGIGNEATVTDAHVVLGRIAENQLAGGEMRIDARRAREAVARVGEKLGLNPVKAATAIVRIANSNMERAIRVVSVERGEDPRGFPLVAFGGCGGLHACEIAAELGIRTVIVPRMAGTLSALGMLLADRARDYSIGALGIEGGVAGFEPLFGNLEAQAKRDLPGGVMQRFADVRYSGQSYELTVRWDGGETAAAFHRLHEKIYGFCDPERSTETVTLRVRATAPVARPDLRFRSRERPIALHRKVWIERRWHEVFCAAREGFPKGLEGPALITDYGSTTLVPPGWKGVVDDVGSLILTH